MPNRFVLKRKNSPVSFKKRMQRGKGGRGDKAHNRVNKTNDLQTRISSKVDLQTHGTQEISRNVTQAASGINEVSKRIVQSASGANTVSRSISEIAAGANEVAQNVSEAATGVNNLNAKITENSVMVKESNRYMKNTNAANASIKTKMTELMVAVDQVSDSV